jgi:hypothetical protein
MYQGNSIVDYLKESGQSSDFASRASLAATKGITGYAGTPEQNTQLLNLLRTNAPASQPKATPTPTATPTASSSSFNKPQTGQPGSAQDLVGMGFQGYAGWGDAEALADFKSTGGQGKGGPSSGGSGIGSSFVNTPTINLPELYNTLFKDSGIDAVQERLSTNTRSYNEAVSRIKDNPYLSEATMTGRLAKLKDRFNADSQADRDEIATKKADIETRLNLQSKQFDINNAQVQNSLSQFNSLLSSGALNSATGEDIANITRATGLSSAIIRSAIDSKKKDDLSIETKTFDDGVNEGFIIYTLDKEGNIVNQTKEITGKSAKKATGGYSTDPVISAYLQSIMGANDIKTLWD